MQTTKRNYNVSEELFKAIEKEFSGKGIAQKFLNSKDPSAFDEWGKNWMKKAFEEGSKPEFNDHLYVMVKQEAEKTGEILFPHEAQRFIELAYLSTHRMSVVNIETSYNKELSFSIMENTCTIYNILSESLTKSEIQELPCKGACNNAIKEIFDLLKMDNVTVTQKHEMPKDGFCTFCAQKK